MCCFYSMTKVMTVKKLSSSYKILLLGNSRILVRRVILAPSACVETKQAITWIRCFANAVSRKLLLGAESSKQGSRIPSSCCSNNFQGQHTCCRPGVREWPAVMTFNRQGGVHKRLHALKRGSIFEVFLTTMSVAIWKCVSGSRARLCLTTWPLPMFVTKRRRLSPP